MRRWWASMRQRRWLPRPAARGLDARVIDAERLPFEREFDAVFSNAALHWVRDHDAMLAGVHRALKPGGRFVAEFGGHGNIAAIQVAIRSVLAHRGWETNIHRYYATPAEYSARLQTHGFCVEPDRSDSPADAAADRHPRVARDIRARDARSHSAGPARVVSSGSGGPAPRGSLRLVRQLDRALRAPAFSGVPPIPNHQSPIPNP